MLLLLLALLLTASILLAFEVATGKTTSKAPAAVWARVVLFGLAACAGGTLLVALPLAEWVLLLALLPLTTIALVRFLTLLTERLPGWRGVAVAAVAVVVGVAAGVQTVPVPLTRAHIQSALPGTPPPSANPNAGRLVRT